MANNIITTADYRKAYERNRENYIEIGITEKENQIALDFAKRAAEKRWNTEGFKGTSKEKLKEAFHLGACAEIATAKYLGEPIEKLEFDTDKEVKDYTHADLECLGYYGLGVKVSRYGLPPMVIMKELWKEGQCNDEIICTVYDNDMDKIKERIYKVWINGIATEEVLKEYQTRDLIFKKDNPKYANRAGFYGFDHLQSLKKENEINAFKLEYRVFREKYF